MKAWFCTLIVATLSSLSILTAESSCYAATANLVVMSANPNGAPTAGIAQYLLGIQVTGAAGPAFLGSNLINFTGNIGNVATTATTGVYTANKALFQSEADSANGVAGYMRVNDSYFASPFRTLLSSPSGAGDTNGLSSTMFIDAGVYGSTGPYQVPGNGTYPFAYVNVTGSPGADIHGELAIGTDHAPIGFGGGVRLTSGGVLQSLLALSGDYNANGAVDAADYVLWRFGGPMQNDPTAGVQPADYDFWRSRFGATTGASAMVGTAPTAIPEPSSIGLLAIAICCNHRFQCGGWRGAGGNS